MLALLVVGVTTGAAAPTVTRAVAVPLPPGPVAVIVYVVESVGFTGVEPCSATLPTPGSISASVASVDVQLSVTVSPLLTDVGEAFSETVGCADDGGGADDGREPATCFLQPPRNPKTAINPNANVICREPRTCMNCLLRAFVALKKIEPEPPGPLKIIWWTSSAIRSGLRTSAVGACCHPPAWTRFAPSVTTMDPPRSPCPACPASARRCHPNSPGTKPDRPRGRLRKRFAFPS